MNKDVLMIDVRVQPRSSRGEIGPVKDGRLGIRTTAVPADGKANEDVVAQLASVFGVPKSNIAIRRGRTSRNKTVTVYRPRLLPDWLPELQTARHGK